MQFPKSAWDRTGVLRFKMLVKVKRPIRWVQRLVGEAASRVPHPRKPFLSITLLVAAWAAWIASMPNGTLTDTQLNLLTEAWGAFGAALVIWFFLSPASEKVENLAWLRAHLETEKPVLMAMIHQAANAVLPYGVSQELFDRMLLARSADARRSAADDVLIAVQQTVQSRLQEARSTGVKIDLGLDLIEAHLFEFELLVKRSSSLVGRFRELEAAIQRYLRSFGDLLSFKSMGFDIEWDPAGEFLSFRIQRMADDALTVVLGCTELLDQMGVYP